MLFLFFFVLFSVFLSFVGAKVLTFSHPHNSTDINYNIFLVSYYLLQL